MFDLKRGDFSGPPLPEQALNEMVEAISRLSRTADVNLNESER